MVASFLAVVLASYVIFKYKIILTKQGVRVESSRLISVRELKWEEIGMVVEDSFSGLYIYHLIPLSYEKKRISIHCSVKNYREILFEVIKRWIVNT